MSWCFNRYTPVFSAAAWDDDQPSFECRIPLPTNIGGGGRGEKRSWCFWSGNSYIIQTVWLALQARTTDAEYANEQGTHTKKRCSFRVVKTNCSTFSLAPRASKSSICGFGPCKKALVEAREKFEKYENALAEHGRENSSSTLNFASRLGESNLQLKAHQFCWKLQFVQPCLRHSQFRRRMNRPLDYWLTNERSLFDRQLIIRYRRARWICSRFILSVLTDCDVTLRAVFVVVVNNFVKSISLSFIGSIYATIGGKWEQLHHQLRWKIRLKARSSDLSRAWFHRKHGRRDVQLHQLFSNQLPSTWPTTFLPFFCFQSTLWPRAESAARGSFGQPVLPLSFLWRLARFFHKHANHAAEKTKAKPKSPTTTIVPNIALKMRILG